MNDRAPSAAIADSEAQVPWALRIRGGAKRAGAFALQMLLVCAIYAVCVPLSELLPIHLPANILAMLLLFGLLAFGIVKEHHVERACVFLLAWMSVFFIPAGVGILGVFDVLQSMSWKFVLVCLVTTVIVFATTAYSLIAATRLEAKIKARRS